MTTTDLEPRITTHCTHVPSPFPACPAFNYHLTRLTDTLFIWVGTGSAAAAADDNDDPSSSSHSGNGKRLATEWAVAMPSRGSIPATSTPLFRPGATDTALPMSQRLAKRFPSYQIHLSLSLPASLTTATGPSLDPYASKALLVMEKRLGAWLAEIVSAKV